MGTGCETVLRTNTPAGKIELIGTWPGGRTGVFRQDSGFHGIAKGEKGEASAGGFDGYVPLVREIVKFLQTGKPPVEPEETLEIYAFMIASDESKAQKGKAVAIKRLLDGVKAPEKSAK
jgi:hypothetical protein